MSKSVFFTVLFSFSVLFGYGQAFSVHTDFGDEGLFTIGDSAQSIVSAITTDNDTFFVLLSGETSSSIVKIDQNGALVDNFGDNGVITLSVSGNNAVRAKQILLNERQLLNVALQTEDANYIAQFQLDGSTDFNFGNNGLVELDADQNQDVFVEVNNTGLYAVSVVSDTITIDKYLFDGDRDLDFRNEGRYKFGVDSGQLIDHILIEGAINALYIAVNFNDDSEFKDAVIYKLLGDTIDLDFAVNGKATLELGEHTTVNVLKSTINDDLQVGGNYEAPFSTPGFIIQLNRFGLQDLSFANDGFVTTTVVVNDFIVDNLGLIYVLSEDELNAFSSEGDFNGGINLDASLPNSINANFLSVTSDRQVWLGGSLNDTASILSLVPDQLSNIGSIEQPNSWYAYQNENGVVQVVFEEAILGKLSVIGLDGQLKTAHRFNEPSNLLSLDLNLAAQVVVVLLESGNQVTTQKLIIR